MSTPPSPPAPLDALGAMLDGYFHQDYRYIYVTPVGAARAFAAEASADEIASAHQQLAAFIDWAARVPRKAWQEALGNAGGAWVPSTIAPLQTVLRALHS